MSVIGIHGGGGGGMPTGAEPVFAHTNPVV